MTLESWQRRPGLLPALRSAVARPLRFLATPRNLPRGRNLAARATRRAAHLSGRAAYRIAGSTVRPGSRVVARTPAGGLVPFASDNVIAKSLWETHEFEREELLTAGRFALPGTCAIDVGANVGLFAVELSRAVGPTGHVFAIEPMTSTADQLRSNIASNDCRNVEVVVAAAGAVNGEVELQVALDPAHHSIATEMLYGQIPLRRVQVRGVTLDQVWADAGRPQVSFVKIDVEGAEEGVLRGALTMIAASRPTMIVEMFDRAQVSVLVGLLPDYEAVAVPGFIWWNYLVRPVS